MEIEPTSDGRKKETRANHQFSFLQHTNKNIHSPLLKDTTNSFRCTHFNVMAVNINTSTYSVQANSSTSIPSPSVPRPLQLVDSNVQSTANSSSTTHFSPARSIYGPPSPQSASRKTQSLRRQSSISYYPSDHTPHWEPRSPARAALVAARRSHSLIIDDALLPNLAGKKNRRSTGSLDVHAVQPERDRGALTLTEKYGFHFICL